MFQKFMMRAGLAVALGFGLVASAQAGDGEDRKIQLVNETSFDIVVFQASRVSANDWEEDIFGDKILPAGETANVDLDDGTGACLFDFRFVFSDETVTTAANVNVCKVGSYYVRE